MTRVKRPFTTDHNFVVGTAGEEAVADILLKRGYKVDSGWPGGPDLILDDFLTVEVKTANLSGRTDGVNSRWQFSLTKMDGQHSPFKEDLLVLRCLSEPPYHFVIPGVLVNPQLQKIDITSEDPRRYRGRWHQFGEKWVLVDMVYAWLLWEGKEPP